MNLPNILTLSRIPLMFIIVWLMFQTWLGAASLAFWLFIAGAISDWLDGYIARKRGITTVFGKLMDALADKILAVAGPVALFVSTGFEHSVANMFIDLGNRVFLTDAQFQAEMAARREKLKSTRNSVVIGCPLCNVFQPPVTAVRPQQ